MIVQRLAARRCFINDSIAAGKYALRRLKFNRCGELASRLSSRLTFAYVYLALRGIHPGVNFSVVVRAIHLGRPAPSGTIVDGFPCLDVVIFGTSRQGTVNTDSCGGVSLPR